MAPIRLRDALFLVGVSLAGFVAIGELALRAYLTRHTFYDVEMTRYSQILKADSDDPRIGHVHRPNREARLMGVSVRINSHGFRDDEFSVEKGPRRRIVFLGDSLTFGWGVEKEETFEHRLERALDAVSPTEILNFGTGNYNTAQEVALFAAQGLAFRPDQVVLFYFINDAEPVPRPSRLEWLGRLRLATFYWSRVKALVARFSPAAGFQEYYAGLYGDGRTGWEETKAAFLELEALCRENGVALQVVLLPELHQLEDYPFAREHAAVAEFLGARGIPVLDLAPAFRGAGEPQALWVARDDAHPNGSAHRLIAEHSFEFVKGAGGS